jgi:tRNA(Ile)-lysidine synthase
LGAKGSRKVKDCMIDRQWDQQKKEKCPLVADQDDKILWIPGFPPDHSSRITANNVEVIRLTYKESGT